VRDKLILVGSTAKPGGFN